MSHSRVIWGIELSDILSSPPAVPMVAGVDEVGRGCLFGPVVAATVVLSPATAEQLAALGVTDSKALSVQRREHLYAQICAQAEDCRVGLASVAEIDRLNILQASLLAMKRSLHRLSVTPCICLVDGNRSIPHLHLPQHTLVKGDQRSIPIAAASIVAKVWRDRLIIRMAQRFPQYDLRSNKGYGTPKHRQALTIHGPTRYHRLSFKPCAVPPAASPLPLIGR